MLDVTLVDDGRRNVKIELEFWKQNSQLSFNNVPDWSIEEMDRLLFI